MWCPGGLGGHGREAWATRRGPRDDFLGVRVPFNRRDGENGWQTDEDFAKEDETMNQPEKPFFL